MTELENQPIDRIYVEWANTLDSTGTDSTEARERLKDRQTLEHIFDNMKGIIKMGSDADLLKKWVFYGKKFEPNHGIHYSSQTVDTAREMFDNHDTVRIFHAVLGLVTEASELMEILKAHLFENTPLNLDKFIDESGDQCWYLALLAKACGFHTFDEFMMSNKAKLTARYGDTWTQDSALNRDKGHEMEVAMESIAKCPTCKHNSHEDQCEAIVDPIMYKPCGCTYTKTQTMTMRVEADPEIVPTQMFTTLNSIVAQLSACLYKDKQGHSIENNVAFLALREHAHRQSTNLLKALEEQDPVVFHSISIEQDKDGNVVTKVNGEEGSMSQLQEFIAGLTDDPVQYKDWDSPTHATPLSEMELLGDIDDQQTRLG